MTSVGMARTSLCWPLGLHVGRDSVAFLQGGSCAKLGPPAAAESTRCLPPQRPGPPGPEATGWGGPLLPPKHPTNPFSSGTYSPPRVSRGSASPPAALFHLEEILEFECVALSFVKCLCSLDMGASKECVDFRATDVPRVGGVGAAGILPKHWNRGTATGHSQHSGHQ